MAQTCENLGEVRFALKAGPTARTALREARSAFEQLQRAVDVRRIDALLAEPDQQHPDANLATALETVAEAHLKRGHANDALDALNEALKLFQSLSPQNDDGIARIRRRISEVTQSGEL